jgi:CheY-like chemotaxis protein
MYKLLLADDSVTIQRVIELTFSGEDVQVLAVNDGEQAIARIPIERPDVVLADIGMPRKGGYEVSAFVKGRADLAHIPVLLLAGAFEPVDQARAEQVKADGVLIKPFEPRQVIERVKELLAVVAQSPRAPLPVPVVAGPEPVPEARPAALAATAQSLDELFESLNHALSEPVKAAAPPAPPAAPEPQPEPESTFEPQPFVLEPPISFEPLATSSSNGATLDDYFDRLSVAFEQASVPAPRPFHPMPDRLEDLKPTAPETPAPMAHPADAWPAQEWLSPSGATPSFDRPAEDANPILEAVTALMAQGAEDEPVNSVGPERTATPPAAGAAPPEPSQAIVDAITERVLARLAPEVAETLRRLVQQEIARTRH